MENTVKNIMDIIAEQKVTKTSNYTTYESKKKLMDAKVLTEKQAEVLTQLKNTFLFNLHNDKKYLVITMYYSKTKSTGFIVLNLHNFDCHQAESVKKAKELVGELIKKDNEVVETMETITTEETITENVSNEETITENVPETETISEEDTTPEQIVPEEETTPEIVETAKGKGKRK